MSTFFHLRNFTQEHDHRFDTEEEALAAAGDPKVISSGDSWEIIRVSGPVGAAPGIHSGRGPIKAN